jgi:hypothetical protein
VTARRGRLKYVVLITTEDIYEAISMIAAQAKRLRPRIFVGFVRTVCSGDGHYGTV